MLALACSCFAHPCTLRTKAAFCLLLSCSRSLAVFISSKLAWWSASPIHLSHARVQTVHATSLVPRALTCDICVHGSYACVHGSYASAQPQRFQARPFLSNARVRAHAAVAAGVRRAAAEEAARVAASERAHAEREKRVAKSKREVSCHLWAERSGKDPALFCGVADLPRHAARG